MDRKTQLFNRFAETNRLECVVSSATKQRRFAGLDYVGALLSEEWMRTIEFAGFVDGYEGHPHKYKGPKGSPDTEFTVGTREISVEPILQKGNWFYRIIRCMRPELQAYSVGVRFQDGTPQVRSYDRQYQLGQIAKREYPG